MSFGDNLDNRVKIFSSDGRFIKSVSKNGTSYGETAALRWHFVDENERIWISDVRSKKISIYDPNGTVQDTLSPLRSCQPRDSIKYWLVPGTIRIVHDKIYVAMHLAVQNNLSSFVPLIKVFNPGYDPLVECFCKYEKIVMDDSLWICSFAFAVDSMQNLYFIHEGTNSIQKYSPEGELVKYFNYPVKDYRPIKGPQPNVKNFRWQQNKYRNAVENWYWSATVMGNVEVFGKYLFVSFSNADSEYVDSNRDLAHRHDYLQAFDLGGNCLVDYLPVKGEFLTVDAAGVLYFRESNKPKETIISRYRFTASEE